MGGIGGRAGALVVLLLALPVLAGEHGSDAERCIACDRVLAEGEGRIESYRGRQVATCSDQCAVAWSAGREYLFGKLQPRGALFQEDARTPRRTHRAWFYGGLYVLGGLLAGAASAYIAVNRGRRALPAFAAGLAFNVIGLGAVALAMKRPRASPVTGIPAGLRKVPDTHAPASCPRCGSPVHPSARECSACRAPLEPRARSEVETTDSR